MIKERYVRKNLIFLDFFQAYRSLLLLIRFVKNSVEHRIVPEQVWLHKQEVLPDCCSEQLLGIPLL